MNAKSAAGEAVPKSPPTVSDLEDPIMDALRMASIAVSSAEHTVGGKPMEKCGAGGMYHLTYDQRENIMFAIIQTERMVEAIKAGWEAIQ